MRKFEKWEIGRFVARHQFTPKKPCYVSWWVAGIPLPTYTVRTFKVQEVAA